MRASEMVDGKWVRVDLPTDPALLEAWLSERDGKEVVLVDDELKRHYCGSQKLIQGYQEKGADVHSFYPLAKQLWQERQVKLKGEPVSLPVDDGKQHPHYCEPGNCCCSEKLPGSNYPAGCVRIDCEHHHGLAPRAETVTGKEI